MFLEKGHLTLGGRRLQKLSGQSYHIDEGFFTTCLCEDGPPTWKISAGEMDVTREGSGKIKRGVFYIMDVPVFYLPYAVFPVRTDRQTGFLFPEIGSSSRSGVRYMQPFYWAISRSTDATLSVGIETKARVGFMGEYRTIFSKDFDAQIDVSYFNEVFRNNANAVIDDRTIDGCDTIPPFFTSRKCHVIEQNRWSVVGNHRQSGASGWTTYSDVALFSDDFFVREMTHNMHFNYDQERDIKTSRYSQSRAGFLRGWGDATLQGEWDYYQDFIQADKRTFQRTPHVAFTGRNILWNTPLELRWLAAGVNYLRQDGADGLRFDFRPELVLPFNFANYLHGALSVAPRETAYHLYDTKESILLYPTTTPQRTFARNSSRELVEVNANVGTSFGRIFSWDGSALQKIKHVVEPDLSYLFVSRSKQNDIPIMDGVDRVQHRNLLTFSLSNRFWGKYSSGGVAPAEDRDVEMVAFPGDGDTRELGRLKLAISYSMEKIIGGNRLSDLDAGLRVTPKDFLALGGDMSINVRTGEVSQATALFSIFDPRPITRRVLDQDFMRPNSVDLTYRFIGKTANSVFAEKANAFFTHPAVPVCPPLPGTLGEKLFDPRCEGPDVMGLVGLHGLLHLTDHLLFIYDAGYNLRRQRLGTNRGSLKILSKCECWSVTLSLNQSTNPAQTDFRFKFDLLGLSSQSKPSFK
jgi:LPS-assembly protein